MMQAATVTQPTVPAENRPTEPASRLSGRGIPIALFVIVIAVVMRRRRRRR